MTDQTLRELARAYGVAVTYVDWQDTEVTVSAETLRAVLTALGVDVSTPTAVHEALARVTGRAERRPPAAVTVIREGSGFPVRPGVRFEIDGVGPIGADGRLPHDLPLGWYSVRNQDGEYGALAYVPDRLRPPARLTGRAVGLMAQLYSIRSTASWGWATWRTSRTWRAGAGGWEPASRS